MKRFAYVLNILVITVALNLLSAQSVFSKYTDQNTDKLNKKLQSVGENGEVDDYRATLAEVLVTKNEAQAMQQLNKLLNKYKGTPMEAGLLFRKAELFVRQSKSARFFEYNRANNNILTMIPKAAKTGNATNKIEAAVDIYEQIERKYPHYADLDLVMFNNAFLRQQLKQEKTSEKIYRKLLSRFPESYLVPDTYLAVGEMLYQQRRYQEALKDYNEIKKYPLAKVYIYGIYKAGWTKYQLKDVEGAIKELELVMDVSSKNVEQNVSKVNLKNEALGDLVLFYPEARESKNAYNYFKKWATDEVGVYILQLAQMYERHSRHKDQEIVLFDLIDGSPKSTQAPLAWKTIIETDINVKNYESASTHLAKFESHCLSHFKEQYKEVSEKVKIDEDDADINCPIVLAKQSLKISQRWHNDWKRKKAQLEKGNFDKSDKVRVEKIADATELAYQIYLRNSVDKIKAQAARFNYSELLFQRKKFRLASEEYFTVAQNIKDEKIKHDSSYFSIIALESAAGDKWSDSDEDRYIELADFYIKNTKDNKYTTDIKFKRAFIAYEKGRYNESLPIFKQLGWRGSDKIAIKSQDLYLDILNIKKEYKEIIEATDHLINLNPEADRKTSLQKIYRESFFAHTQELEKEGKAQEASQKYYKFALENKDSALADKAFWNYLQLLIKQNDIGLAADKSFELYRMFPKSEFAKKSLLKSFELNDYIGNTKQAAAIAFELIKVESKDFQKWSKIAADYSILSYDFKKGIDIYKELLKNPDSEIRQEITSKLISLKINKVYESKDLDALIQKYSKVSLVHADLLQVAKSKFEKRDYTAAFKMASELVGDKDASKLIQAEARLIQAEILKSEFESQSVKTKVERIEMVLAMKTEKLDKAQRAFESVIKYGNSEATVKSFLSLAKMYEHYIYSLKNIQITDEISKKDKELLIEEIEKIIMPIEEKIADTLQQGIDFSNKYPTYSGMAYELKNELNRINFKGYKFVKYSVVEPKVALPTSL